MPQCPIVLFVDADLHFSDAHLLHDYICCLLPASHVHFLRYFPDPVSESFTDSFDANGCAKAFTIERKSLKRQNHDLPVVSITSACSVTVTSKSLFSPSSSVYTSVDNSAVVLNGVATRLNKFCVLLTDSNVSRYNGLCLHEVWCQAGGRTVKVEHDVNCEVNYWSQIACVPSYLRSCAVIRALSLFFFWERNSGCCDSDSDGDDDSDSEYENHSVRSRNTLSASALDQIPPPARVVAPTELRDTCPAMVFSGAVISTVSVSDIAACSSSGGSGGGDDSGACKRKRVTKDSHHTDSHIRRRLIETGEGALPTVSEVEIGVDLSEQRKSQTPVEGHDQQDEVQYGKDEEQSHHHPEQQQELLGPLIVLIYSVLKLLWHRHGNLHNYIPSPTTVAPVPVEENCRDGGEEVPLLWRYVLCDYSLHILSIPLRSQVYYGHRWSADGNRDRDRDYKIQMDVLTRQYREELLQSLLDHCLQQSDLSALTANAMDICAGTIANSTMMISEIQASVRTTVEQQLVLLSAARDGVGVSDSDDEERYKDEDEKGMHQPVDKQRKQRAYFDTNNNNKSSNSNSNAYIHAHAHSTTTASLLDTLYRPHLPYEYTFQRRYLRDPANTSNTDNFTSTSCDGFNGSSDGGAPADCLGYQRLAQTVAQCRREVEVGLAHFCGSAQSSVIRSQLLQLLRLLRLRRAAVAAAAISPVGVPAVVHNSGFGSSILPLSSHYPYRSRFLSNYHRFSYLTAERWLAEVKITLLGIRGRYGGDDDTCGNRRSSNIYGKSDIGSGSGRRLTVRERAEYLLCQVVTAHSPTLSERMACDHCGSMQDIFSLSGPCGTCGQSPSAGGGRSNDHGTRINDTTDDSDSDSDLNSDSDEENRTSSSSSSSLRQRFGAGRVKLRYKYPGPVIYWLEDSAVHTSTPVAPAVIPMPNANATNASLSIRACDSSNSAYAAILNPMWPVMKGLACLASYFLAQSTPRQSLWEQGRCLRIASRILDLLGIDSHALRADYSRIPVPKTRANPDPRPPHYPPALQYVASTLRPSMIGFVWELRVRVLKKFFHWAIRKAQLLPGVSGSKGGGTGQRRRRSAGGVSASGTSVATTLSPFALVSIGRTCCKLLTDWGVDCRSDNDASLAVTLNALRNAATGGGVGFVGCMDPQIQAQLNQRRRRLLKRELLSAVMAQARRECDICLESSLMIQDEHLLLLDSIQQSQQSQGDQGEDVDSDSDSDSDSEDAADCDQFDGDDGSDKIRDDRNKIKRGTRCSGSGGGVAGDDGSNDSNSSRYPGSQQQGGAALGSYQVRVIRTAQVFYKSCRISTPILTSERVVGQPTVAANTEGSGASASSATIGVGVNKYRRCCYHTPALPRDRGSSSVQPQSMSVWIQFTDVSGLVMSSSSDSRLGVAGSKVCDGRFQIQSIEAGVMFLCACHSKESMSVPAPLSAHVPKLNDIHMTVAPILSPFPLPDVVAAGSSSDDDLPPTQTEEDEEGDADEEEEGQAQEGKMANTSNVGALDEKPEDFVRGDVWEEQEQGQGRNTDESESRHAGLAVSTELSFSLPSFVPVEICTLRHYLHRIACSMGTDAGSSSSGTTAEVTYFCRPYLARFSEFGCDWSPTHTVTGAPHRQPDHWPQRHRIQRGQQSMDDFKSEVLSCYQPSGAPAGRVRVTNNSINDTIEWEVAWCEGILWRCLWAVLLHDQVFDPNVPHAYPHAHCYWSLGDPTMKRSVPALALVTAPALTSVPFSAAVLGYPADLLPERYSFFGVPPLRSGFYRARVEGLTRRLAEVRAWSEKKLYLETRRLFRQHYRCKCGHCCQQRLWRQQNQATDRDGCCISSVAASAGIGTDDRTDSRGSDSDGDCSSSSGAEPQAPSHDFLLDDTFKDVTCSTLASFACALGPIATAEVLKAMAREPDSYFRGMPDLVFWRRPQMGAWSEQETHEECGDGDGDGDGDGGGGGGGGITISSSGVLGEGDPPYIGDDPTAVTVSRRSTCKNSSNSSAHDADDTPCFPANSFSNANDIDKGKERAPWLQHGPSNPNGNLVNPNLFLVEVKSFNDVISKFQLCWLELCRACNLAVEVAKIVAEC